MKSGIWRRLAAARRGVSTVEYIVLVGAIAVFALLILPGLGIPNPFEEVAKRLDPPDGFTPPPAPNGPPVAGDVSLAGVFEGVAVFTAQELLANSSDPEDETLSVVGAADAVAGSLLFDEDAQTVSFTGGLAANTGSFTFTVADPAGATDSATATIDMLDGTAMVSDTPVGRDGGADSGSFSAFEGNCGLAEFQAELPIPVSENGRYIAFASQADDVDKGSPLLPADFAGGHVQIFRQDRVTDEALPVSIRPDGQPAGADVCATDMSDDGRYVVMSSTADLDGGGPYGVRQVFVRDMAAGTTVRVSVDETAGGGPAPDDCGNGTIANDGSRVAFWCENMSDHLDADLPGISAFAEDWAFAADLASDLTVTDVALITLPVGASAPDFVSSGPPFIAADAPDSIIFDSDDEGMVPGVTLGGGRQIYRRDMATGTTEWLSRNSDGSPWHEDARLFGVSDDGAFAAYINQQFFNFGTLERIALGAAAPAETAVVATIREDGSVFQATIDAGRRALSGDGQKIVFATSTDDVVTAAANGGPDTGGDADVFMRRMDTGVTVRASLTDQGNELAKGGGGGSGSGSGGSGGAGYSIEPVGVSDKGAFVLFGTDADNVLESLAYDHDFHQIYARQPLTGVGAPPRLAAIERQDPANPPGSLFGEDSVVLRVTFNQDVAFVDATDFVIDDGTTPTPGVGTIAGVAPAGAPDRYDVTVTGLLNFEGRVGLELKSPAAGMDVESLGGVAVTQTAPTTGIDETYDFTLPEMGILAIRHFDPADPPPGTPVSRESVIFEVEFTREVQNVDITDFATYADDPPGDGWAPSSPAPGTVAAIAQGGDASIYRVTVEGFVDFEGVVGIVPVDPADGMDIQAIDGAMPALTNPEPTSGIHEEYEIDTIPPRLLSITRIDPIEQNITDIAYGVGDQRDVSFRVTFDDDLPMSVTADDFEIAYAPAPGFGPSTAVIDEVDDISAFFPTDVYDLTVADPPGTLGQPDSLALYSGEIGLDLAAGHGLADAAGNALLDDTPPDEIFILDNQPSCGVTGTESVTAEPDWDLSVPSISTFGANRSLMVDLDMANCVFSFELLGAGGNGGNGRTLSAIAYPDVHELPGGSGGDGGRTTFTFTPGEKGMFFLVPGEPHGTSILVSLAGPFVSAGPEGGGASYVTWVPRDEFGNFPIDGEVVLGLAGGGGTGQTGGTCCDVPWLINDTSRDVAVLPGNGGAGGGGNSAGSEGAGAQAPPQIPPHQNCPDGAFAGFGQVISIDFFASGGGGGSGGAGGAGAPAATAIHADSDCNGSGLTVTWNFGTDAEFAAGDKGEDGFPHNFAGNNADENLGLDNGAGGGGSGYGGGGSANVYGGHGGGGGFCGNGAQNCGGSTGGGAAGGTGEPAAGLASPFGDGDHPSMSGDPGRVTVEWSQP